MIFIASRVYQAAVDPFIVDFWIGRWICI